MWSYTLDQQDLTKLKFLEKLANFTTLVKPKRQKSTCISRPSSQRTQELIFSPNTKPKQAMNRTLSQKANRSHWKPIPAASIRSSTSASIAVPRMNFSRTNLWWRTTSRTFARWQLNALIVTIWWRPLNSKTIYWTIAKKGLSLNAEGAKKSSLRMSILTTTTRIKRR